MSTNFEIRQALPDDYAAIAAIYNEHIELGKSSMEERLKTEQDISSWVKKFNRRERLYVGCIDQQIVGWGIIKRYSDREGYRFTCETAIYLQAAHLGKGLGTKFKQYIILRCKEMDYHHLVAKIFASNEASILYNQKLGYEIVGRQKEIGYKNGKWVDVVIMQLLI